MVKIHKEITVSQLDNPLEYCRQYYRLVRKKNPVHLMYLSCKSNAKVRGIKFTIKEEDIKVPKRCPVLGIQLKQQRDGKISEDCPSLDRINNKKGYIPGNVRVISYKANSCKNNLTIKQVEKLLAYMKGEI